MKEIRIKLITPEPAYDYKVQSPADSIMLMQEIIGSLAQAYFASVFLDTKNRPMDFLIAGIGNASRSSIDPGSTIQGALLQNASKILLFHNHPSGDTRPSGSDLATTQKFILAAKLAGMEILDHIIISEDSYYSFAEHGHMDIADTDYLSSLRELKNMSMEDYNAKYAFRTGITDKRETEEEHGIRQE